MKIYATIKEIKEIKEACDARCGSCKWSIVCDIMNACPVDWDDDNAIVQAKLKKGIESDETNIDD